ncbi:MAG: acetyl-CoA synthetase [Haloplanus sp.]
MHVLGDLVARERRDDRTALRVADRGRAFSYREFCTTTWKVGHALRHLGVHAGSRVALAPDPTPPILQTLFGGALLGARITFDVSADARVVMGHVDREADLDGRVVVYGGAPDAATTTHWESVVWSENPAMPPGEPSPEDPMLDWTADDRRSDGDDRRSLAHRELLSRAKRVADSAGLDSETAVALRAPLSDPRAVVAGVVAPLLAGGTVVVPDGDAAADVAVSDGAVPEHRRIDLDAV